MLADILNELIDVRRRLDATFEKLCTHYETTRPPHTEAWAPATPPTIPPTFPPDFGTPLPAADPDACFAPRPMTLEEVAANYPPPVPPEVHLQNPLAVPPISSSPVPETPAVVAQYDTPPVPAQHGQIVYEGCAAGQHGTFKYE